MSDLYERRQVTAHRAHKCHLCGETIPPGAVYIREKWRDDEFHEVKRHIHCDALLDEYLNDNTYTSEYYDDEVWDWIRDRCLELCGSEKREDCECNPYSCERMIGSVANINSRNAAMDSIRACKD